MARTATGDRSELEAQLGARGSLRVTSDNRNTVRRWLRARGMAGALVQTLPLSVLEKAYNAEADFQAMQTIIATAVEGDATMNATATAQDATTFASDGGESKTNRFAGPCCVCDAHVEKGAGKIWRGIGHSNWRLYCADHRPNPVAGELQVVADEFEYPQDNGAPQIAAKPTQDNDDAAKKLQDAIRMIADMATPKKSPLDRDEVSAMVREELKRAMANGPALVIELRREGDLVARIEGRQHKTFPALLKAASARDANGYSPNVWLAGPAGSGKTRACANAFQALGIGFEHNGALAMPHELVGFIDAAGTYHTTAFRNAYENGAGYLFDEVDGSDNSALLALNAALANGEARFPDKSIERHKETRIFAAANTWGMGATADFVGRARIDAAFLDRFPVRIHWDYDAELELAISGNPDFARRVQAARAKAASAGLKVAITPRASIAGAALIAAGFTADEAASMTYLANLTPEQKRQVA